MNESNTNNDSIEILAENLREGDSFEVTPGVFWEVVAIETTHFVKVQLAHHRAYTFNAGHIVKIARDKA